MNKSFLQKKIPNLFVVLFLIIVVGITSNVAQNGIGFIGRASPTNTPENITISDIKENSFTVFYTTANIVSGVLLKDTKEPVQDDKDIQDKTTGFYGTHFFTVKNLKPDTEYSFSLVSGADIFENNGSSYKAKTAPTLSISPSSSHIVKGTVLLPNGEKPENGILSLSTNDSQIISTLLNSDGSYAFDLSQLLTKSLTSYIEPSPQTIFTMNIYSAQLYSKITFLGNQKDTLPMITLSQNYDFTFIEKDSKSQTASQEATLTGFPSLGKNSGQKKKLEILSPKKDEAFIDQQPLFSGIASPGAQIDIEIHSEESIKTQIKAGTNGIWSYRPTSSLSPGEHIISIITRDEFGVLKTIRQSFVVYAEGSQVNQSATPSATPFFTPTPTFSPTPTPTVTPSSPSPTIIQTPTPTPIIIAIIPTVNTAPPPHIEDPGNSFLPIGFSILATMAFGIIIFTLTKRTP